MKPLTINEEIVFEPTGAISPEAVKELTTKLHREFGFDLDIRTLDLSAPDLSKQIIGMYEDVSGGIHSNMVGGFIGGWLTANRLTPTKHLFRIVHDFKWRAGDYGDAQSCLFNGDSDAPAILQHNPDAFAIQFLSQKTKKGIGRALAYKLEDAWIVYNAYGKLFDSDALVPSISSTKARQDNKVSLVALMLSQITEAEVKRIRLTFNGRNDSPIYVNSGVGYIVGEPKLIKYAVEVDVTLNTEIDGRCPRCRRAKDDIIDVDPAYCEGYRRMCKRCANDYQYICQNCGITLYRHLWDKSTWIEARGPNFFCSPKCASEAGFRRCASCNVWTDGSYLTWVDSEKTWYCVGCTKNKVRSCIYCMHTYPIERFGAFHPKGATSQYAVYACKECGDNLEKYGSAKGEKK